MSQYAIADALRGMAVFLFLVVVSQVVHIAWHYFQVVRHLRRGGRPVDGILPRHVTVLGVVLIGFSAEAVVQNIIRVGEPPNYFLYLNPALLLTAIWGLRLVQVYERLRYKGLTGPLA